MASRNRRHAPLPKDYVVVDVETTGLSITQDEIIEIGAILVKGRTVERKFHALIKPAGSVPAPVQALTGITDELLARKGRGLAEVLREFLSFVGELPVVSHNIDFDYGFLRAACTRCHLPPLTNRYVDTLALSKRHVNEVDNYKLATLAGYFGIEVTKAHRSLDDCCVTKQLYEKLNELRLMQE